MDEEIAYLLVKTSYGKGASPVFSVCKCPASNVSRTHKLGEVLDVFASVQGAADAQIDAVKSLRRGRNAKIPGINLRPLAQKRNGDLRNLKGAMSLIHNLLRDHGMKETLGYIMVGHESSIHAKIVENYEKEVRRLQGLGDPPPIKAPWEK